jgi:hypothetical protein
MNCIGNMKKRHVLLWVAIGLAVVVSWLVTRKDVPVLTPDDAINTPGELNHAHGTR